MLGLYLSQLLTGEALFVVPRQSPDDGADDAGGDAGDAYAWHMN